MSPKKPLLKWMSCCAVFAASSLVILPPTQPSPVNGVTIVEGHFGDFDNFNPLFATNEVTQLIFPTFIGVNPDTGLFEKDSPNALATDWSISENGTVYTFLLRTHLLWSDGVPITSKDILYGWNAIASGAVNTPLMYLKERIVKVETPDPTTLQITFATADCSALNDASFLPILPSHILPVDFSALSTSTFNTNPTVTGGIFQFSSLLPADKVVLSANQMRTATAAYIYKLLPDQTQRLGDFTAGKLDVITNPPPNKYAELRQNPRINTYTFAGNTWDYLALNYADPLHPTNGRDEKGTVLDQGHHPLFGDLRVRQAIARALDVNTLMAKAVLGEATRMVSAIIPSSWAYNRDLQPIAYDLDAARSLLDKAGWIDDDHNPDTPRIAKGAKYAPDGTVFKFTLYTNEGGSRRDSVVALISDQLHQVGIEANYQAIDFTKLMDLVNNQKFDAYVLGWRSSYPDNPDLSELFTPAGDVVGSGLNSTSYNNPLVDELIRQAQFLSGCDPTARAEIYGKIQEFLQQDLPYIWLYAFNEMYAAQKTVIGFDPRPNQLYWNIDKWSLAKP